MQIRPEQLEQFLKQGLSSCYLVTGAEPLIVQECADAIRVAARERGCVDRERIDTSDKDGWQNLVQSASAMSLWVEEAAELCRVRRRSTKLNESYAKNLLALREALSQVKQQADVHPSLPAEDKTSWGTTLERAIRWIEHPESDF